MAGVMELRSRHSVHKSFLRFYNNTQRQVDVVWVNYEGQHVKYKTLLPGNYIDVNSFSTHPWLFVDSQTKDRLVVKSREVYMPEPWFAKYLPLRHAGQWIERTNVYITIPVFSLRQRALQVLRDYLSCPEDASKLEIPVILQKELAKLMRESNRRPIGSSSNT